MERKDEEQTMKRHNGTVAIIDIQNKCIRGHVLERSTIGVRGWALGHGWGLN